MWLWKIWCAAASNCLLSAPWTAQPITPVLWSRTASIARWSVVFLLLTAALLLVQSAQALDDLAEMLIKRMLAIHQKGKEALQQYHLEHQARTDALFTTLRDLVVAYRKEGTTDERFTAIEGVLGEQSEEVLKQCEEHLAYAGNTYQQLLWSSYRSHRATLFRLLSVVSFRSST